MNDKEVCFDQTQYLTFHLAGEEYAVGILQVKEIITYGTLTKVPHTPASIRGVINLRGNVVPVVDLGVKFGLAASPVTDRTCIVIVEANINDTADGHGGRRRLSQPSDQHGRRQHLTGAGVRHPGTRRFFARHGEIGR